MQYSRLLIFSAAIAMSMAAPVEEVSALEVQLQRALDSASAANLLATKESDGDAGDLVLGIADTVLNFIRNNRKRAQSPSMQRIQIEEDQQEISSQSKEAEMEVLSNVGGILKLITSLIPSSGTGSGGTGGPSGLVNMILQLIRLFGAGQNGGGNELQAVMEALDQMTDEEAAEIEGFRSFLDTALGFVDRKLKPSSRTADGDRRAVNNPTKWVDLGRNLLRTVREKLNQRQQQPKGEIMSKRTQRFLDDFKQQ